MDHTSKQASQSSFMSSSQSSIMFCEQKMTSSSSICCWLKKLSYQCSVGSSSSRKKQCSIFSDTSSFYQMVIGDSSYIQQWMTVSYAYFLSPMNTWHIYSCFLAAFCIACRCRAKADERREPCTLLKVIYCIWLGEMQSSCQTCSFRPTGRQFSCSLCRKGLGISNYCYFETLRFDTRLAFFGKRGARVSWRRGELLKLCIVEYRRLIIEKWDRRSIKRSINYSLNCGATISQKSRIANAVPPYPANYLPSFDLFEDGKY